MSCNTLKRYDETADYTLGYMRAYGRILYTIERPWLENRREVSRIPAGRYKLVPKAHSNQRIFLDGNGISIAENRHCARFAVQIHVGNWQTDVVGCVAAGWHATWDEAKSQPMVQDSGNACRWLYEQVAADTFPELEIVDRF